MTDNPYKPPTSSSDDTLANGKQRQFDPPRYRGSLSFIQGEIDEDTAVAFAAACKSLEVSGEFVKPKKRLSISTALMLVAAIIIAVLVFFEGSWVAGASPPPRGRSPNFVNFAAFIVLPLIVMVALLFFFRRLRFRYEKCDPPLGGVTLIKLNPVGCSIEKTTRDNRPIEVFCSWRQVQITDSPDAWLLNIGMVNPFLVVKSWITNNDELAIFEDLKMDIVRWQSEQEPHYNLESIPDEAAESFPDYQTGATALTVSSATEREARKSVASALRVDLPEYHSAPFRWGKLIWSCVLVGLVVLLVGVIATTDWSEGGANWNTFWNIVPLVVVIGFGLRVTYLVRREITVSAAISDENLWYDYRSLLLRLPLDSLPYRRLVAGNLVLSTPTGGTAIVLHPAHFESPEAFQSISERLTAEPKSK